MSEHCTYRKREIEKKDPKQHKATQYKTRDNFFQRKGCMCMYNYMYVHVTAGCEWRLLALLFALVFAGNEVADESLMSQNHSIMAHHVYISQVVC